LKSVSLNAQPPAIALLSRFTNPIKFNTARFFLPRSSRPMGNRGDEEAVKTLAVALKLEYYMVPLASRLRPSW
jgi:hypothetical protein